MRAFAKGAPGLWMTWRAGWHLEGDSEKGPKAQSLTDAGWCYDGNVCFPFGGMREVV